MPFERWSQQIVAAETAESQQALLGQIGVWRARNLTDIPAQREAAFAVSRLQGLLGNHAESVREARSLLSLCQTSPAASREELAHAKAYLASLGASVPKVRAPRKERNDRSNRRDTGRAAAKPSPKAAATREDVVMVALKRVADGDHQGALKLLKGKKGRAELARVWVKLDRALQLEGDARDAELRKLDRGLRQSLGVPSASKAAPESRTEPSEPQRPPEGPLETLIGAALPKRRDAMVRACEAWLADHPHRQDDLAAAALRHHLATAGPDAAAPWLAAFVVQAFDGEHTTAALSELREAGSIVLPMFAEAPFAQAVQLYKASPETFAGLRRGVLRRREAVDDRRLWTYRTHGGERMLVLAPPVDTPWPDAAVAAVVERLPRLCNRVAVHAPGSGNAGLREALASAGFLTLDGEPSPAELFAALDNANVIEPPPREKRAPKQADKVQRAEKPPEPEQAPARPAGPDLLEQLRSLIGATEVATAEALEPVLGGMRKLRDAFLETARQWETLPDDASARLAPLLHAADSVAPAGLKVPEAVTLALRVAARLRGPTLEALEGPVAERFAGPGLADVVDIVAAADAAGWRLRRAFLGTTRRERRNNAGLAELSGALDGLWRLEVEKDGVRRQLWFVAELPIEGRAALPQLLLDEGERTVLLPIDAELSTWYSTLDGPEAIGWAGPDSAEAVVSALNG